MSTSLFRFGTPNPKKGLLNSFQIPYFVLKWSYKIRNMNITFLGINCFKIQSKNVVVITDPFGKETGLKPVKAKADIVTVSKNDSSHSYTSGIQGNPFIIDKAGEYEVKSVFIQGLSSQSPNSKEKNITYLIEIEGVRFLHLGDLASPLSGEARDKFNGVDVLIVPVGGKGILKIDRTVELINQIEPRAVIPMHYNLPGLKEKLAPLSRFCEEMGISEKNKLEKLSLKKKDLPTEETEVYILKKV